jgi:hypothetical protein
MRLSCRFVMFRRFVVFFFHAIFSLLAEECRLCGSVAPIVAASRGDGVFSRLPKAEVYNVMPSTLEMPKTDLKVHSPLSTHADNFFRQILLTRKM